MTKAAAPKPKKPVRDTQRPRDEPDVRVFVGAWSPERARAMKAALERHANS